jgi:hypothetical protein
MKYPNIQISAFLLLAILCLSCKDDSRNKIAHLVTEWQGKEVLLPENSIFTIQAKDTVQMDLHSPKNKILVYVDSTGCTSCRLQLHKWKEFIAEVDSATNKETQFLFFLSPKSLREAQYITRRDDFTHPICIDMYNQLDSLNHFPEEEMFHTFLLDMNNKIKVIGNPIHNKRVHELYMEALIESKALENTNTNIEVSAHKKNLGVLAMGEEKNVVFTLHNKGVKPLIIFDVTTACDCTNVKYPKKPIKPGECAEITIKYIAGQKGIFNKSITIYSNAGDEPIRLHIFGEVK